MKKLRSFQRLLFTAVLMLTMVQSLSAQSNSKDDFGYMDIYAGPRVGAALSNLTQLDGDFRIGPNIGGFLELRITPKIAVSFELGYTYEGTRNAKCSFIDDDPDKTSNISMHLLNSGYRFRYYVLPQLNLSTGLHLSRLLRAFGETDGTSVKIHHQIHRGNLSIPFSAEFNLNRFVVEASYYLPLRKWARNNNNNKLSEVMGTAKTNLVTLTVGYKIQVF